MSTVIYRKYRPSSFADVIGQDSVISILKEAIKSQKLSHAYLFAGPRGTGKTSVARLLSQAVNCTNFVNSLDVCNECEACKSIVMGAHLDIIEMDAASNRGIDEIRSLRDSVNFMPNALNKKVYIIDEAHMLTKDAFNALLKTLEEPPEHVLFILATTEAHKLPITILSRVQRHDFKLVGVDQLRQKLERIFKEEGLSVEDGVFDILYTHSNGSFRDAESLVGKIISSFTQSSISTKEVFAVLGLVEEEIVDDFVQNLIEGNITEALATLEDLSKDEVNISVFIDQLLENLRKRLVKGDTKVLPAIKSFIEARRDMKVVYDKLLPLQVALMSLKSNSQSVLPTSKVASDDLNKSIQPKIQKPINDNPKGLEAKVAQNQIADTEKPNMKEGSSNITIDTLQEFIKSSDLPMIIKNQLRATKMYLNGGNLKIVCEPETHSFFTNNGKMSIITNSFVNRLGLKSVSIESSGEASLEQVDATTSNASAKADNSPESDNSDIVEELL